MNDPSLSLAACPHNNCLYVSEYELNDIHRVDLSNSSISNWLVGGRPWGLHVTRNHHLLVTLPELLQRIHECTTHGSVMRRNQSGCHYGQTTTLNRTLSSGQLVVCHGGYHTIHRVCTVDTSGRIVQHYGGPPGSSAGQLNGPHCLAVDKRGYVLIADWFNNKVQLLSPELTHLCDITLPDHMLGGPWRLHLDDVNDRLYFGEWWGGGGCLYFLRSECLYTVFE